MAINKRLQIKNDLASLTVDLHGGAITDFQLIQHPINPLSFAFKKAQMPKNNQAGAPYQGHFICMPYWGLPSAAEIKKGKPNHGDFSNIEWQAIKQNEKNIEMQSVSLKEKMLINRKIKLGKKSARIKVREKIINSVATERPFNIVQHPTIAVPFLSNKTRIDCNGYLGFNQAHFKDAEKKKTNWPHGMHENGNLIDLSNPENPYNSVFSFIVNPIEKYGWVTAYSPEKKLILGYIWERKDYPWINIWRHWQKNKLTYLGIEFGTTGIHQPYKDIKSSYPTLFGEKTISFLKPGETIKKRYTAFLIKTWNPIKKINEVAFSKVDKKIIIKTDSGIFSI